MKLQASIQSVLSLVMVALASTSKIDSMDLSSFNFCFNMDLDSCPNNYCTYPLMPNHDTDLVSDGRVSDFIIEASGYSSSTGLIYHICGKTDCTEIDLANLELSDTTIAHHNVRNPHAFFDSHISTNVFKNADNVCDIDQRSFYY